FEQTILYEFGFTNQFARDWAIDIKSYVKEISNQVGTTHLRPASGLAIELYDNKAYSRARGLEFEIIKRYSNFSSGKINYTMQWANGYSSSAFDDYIRSLSDFPYPIRERRLGWDIRHQVVFNATLSSPEGKHLNIFGLSFPDKWDITVLSRLSSGSPYTSGTNDPIEFQKTENNASGPPIYSTDIKFRKFINLKSARLTVYLDIFNVFNQKNIQIGYGFNTWTGKPYKYGDVFQNTNRGYDWYAMYNLMDPRQFSLMRYTKIGVSIDFKTKKQ
ncbi:MAG: hypothetical protein DRP89_08215, partial [Candidatus Neomarinimicrobiota bacterium]